MWLELGVNSELGIDSGDGQRTSLRTAALSCVLAKWLNLNLLRQKKHYFPLVERSRGQRIPGSVGACASWAGLVVGHHSYPMAMADASTFGIWNWRVAAVLLVPDGIGSSR